MTSDEQRRLWDLFAACLQENLSSSEQAELQSLLSHDKQARQLWFQYLDVELGLKRLLRVAADDLQPSQSGQHVRVEDVKKPIVQRGYPAMNKFKNSSPSVFGLRSSVVIAAALLCLSFVFVSRMQLVVSRPDKTHKEHSLQKELSANDGLSINSPTHGTTFTVKQHHGKLIALHFLLKSECPFCLKLTHDYALLAQSTPDVLHLFIKPDNDEEIRSWAAKVQQDQLQGPPIIYRDADEKLAEAYHIPDGYQFHGQSVHYPALVLIDDTGKELFRHVGKDNSDRMAPEEFTTRLALLQSQKSSVDQAN